MISAYDYYSKVAKPTADRFLEQNNDIACALLACMATLHVIDYVAQNQEPSDVDAGQRRVKSLKQRCKDQLGLSFDVVEGFALASKHCRLSKAPFRGFDSGSHMIAPPAIYGQARWDQSLWDDKIGGVTIQWKDGEPVNLSTALKETLAFYESEFPEIVQPP